MNEISSTEEETASREESDAISALMSLGHFADRSNESSATSSMDIRVEYPSVYNEDTIEDSTKTITTGSDVVFIDYSREREVETSTPFLALEPPKEELTSSSFPLSSSAASPVPQSLTPSIMGRLSVIGFESVQSYLSTLSTSLRPENVYLDMDIARLSRGGNPAFCIDDNPLAGWRKEITIRMIGHMRGTTEVTYAPPDRSCRIRTKVELAKYLSQHRVPLQRMVLFNFSKVYCVCHQPECRRYLECSYGKGGCNGWVHSECVGLGVRVAAELSQMKRVICPLCYHYLNGTGELENYAADATVIREFGGEAANTTEINGFEVEECPIGHTSWGLSGDCDLNDYDEVIGDDGPEITRGDSTGQWQWSQSASTTSEQVGDETADGASSSASASVKDSEVEEKSISWDPTLYGVSSQSHSESNKAKKVSSHRFSFTHSLLSNIPVANAVKLTTAPSSSSSSSSSGGLAGHSKSSSQSKRKHQDIDQSVSNILQHRLFQFSSVVPADIEQAIRQPANKKYQYQTPVIAVPSSSSSSNKKSSHAKKSATAPRTLSKTSLPASHDSEGESEQEEEEGGEQEGSWWDDGVPPQDRVYEHTVEIKSEVQVQSGDLSPAAERLIVPDSEGAKVSAVGEVTATKKILIKVTGGWMKPKLAAEIVTKVESSEDEPLSAAELKSLILSKAAAAKQRARDANLNLSIHDKIRRNLLEATQQMVHSLRKNKRSRTSAAAQAAADTYHLTPSHGWLPLADGGLRLATLSCGEASLLRPQQALEDEYEKNGGLLRPSSRFGVLCGFCFNSFPNTAFTQLQSQSSTGFPISSSLMDVASIASGSNSKDSQWSSKQNKKLRSAGPSASTEEHTLDGRDAQTVVEYVTPTLSCCMHKSCAHLLKRLQKGEELAWLNQHSCLSVGSIIECPSEMKTNTSSSSKKRRSTGHESDSDDNDSHSDGEQSHECILCGRSGEGGVMQELSVRSPGGVTASQTELLLLQGLAHISCIFYLSHSSALQSFAARIEEQSSLLSHFPTRFVDEEEGEEVGPQVEESRLSPSEETFPMVDDQSMSVQKSEDMENDSMDKNKEEGISSMINVVTSTNPIGNVQLDLVLSVNVIEDRIQTNDLVGSELPSNLNGKEVVTEPINLWSSFERQYAAHRCSVCGLQAGLTLRCSASGCCTYSHPLCVAESKHSNYFLQRGQLCNVNVSHKIEAELASSLGFLCWFHA